MDYANSLCKVVVAAAWSPKQGPLSGRVQRYHEGENNKNFTLEIMEDNFYDRQIFDTDYVFGAKISQTIIETPLEYRFVWAHWRHHHTFVTVSTLKIFDLSKSKP